LREDNGLKKEVEEHIRPFALHALRHLRATELVEFYGFNGYNLSTYGGWTLKTVVGVSASIERYLSLSWHNYFEKMLKRRNQGSLDILRASNTRALVLSQNDRAYSSAKLYNDISVY
jgi:hypothetical protein